jgi:hypothetical protein
MSAPIKSIKLESFHMSGECRCSKRAPWARVEIYEYQRHCCAKVWADHIRWFGEPDPYWCTDRCNQLVREAVLRDLRRLRGVRNAHHREEQRQLERIVGRISPYEGPLCSINAKPSRCIVSVG